MQQTTYSHYKSGNHYRIIDHCAVQINDQWVEAYIYVKAGTFGSVYSTKFVRPITEFHEKFKPVLDDPDIHSTQDGDSLLDHIRQGQLSAIFGKYKLF